MNIEALKKNKTIIAIIAALAAAMVAFVSTYESKTAEDAPATDAAAVVPDEAGPALVAPPVEAPVAAPVETPADAEPPMVVPVTAAPPQQQTVEVTAPPAH